MCIRVMHKRGCTLEVQLISYNGTWRVLSKLLPIYTLYGALVGLMEECVRPQGASTSCGCELSLSLSSSWRMEALVREPGSRGYRQRPDAWTAGGCPISKKTYGKKDSIFLVDFRFCKNMERS